jgi:DnaJ-class molecular chaperone
MAMNGKGDTYRPVDQKKYNINWLRIFGMECPVCKGRGYSSNGDIIVMCKECDGNGFVEKLR